MYSVSRGSKYILSDRAGEFTSKQFTWLAEEMGFIKVYTSPLTLIGNSVIEHTHSFLESFNTKPNCNHNTDWDELAHVEMMVYNVVPHLLAGEAPFYLMFGWDTFMPTLFKLLLPNCRYMGDEGCRIYLNAIRETDMMAVLNLRIARDKCPPPTREKD